MCFIAFSTLRELTITLAN